MGEWGWGDRDGMRGGGGMPGRVHIIKRPSICVETGN